MKFDKEFKLAISHLSDKEKDRLLLRLLKKDTNLANQLYFELVSTVSVEELREKLEKRIEFLVERMRLQYYSVGYLHADVRFASGEINEHVRITKDKFGNASLNLLLINLVLEDHSKTILKLTRAQSRKFVESLIARSFKIIILINKLDEDFLIEFESGLVKLGGFFADNDHLMKCAINNGFDVNWLLHAQIPEDIETIYKEARNTCINPYTRY